MKRILLLTVVFIMMLGTSFSFAQADADNFYKSDWVKVEKVSFSNQYKMKVAGNLFLPKTMKEGEKYPAIIVGHPMGAVKEQSANLYATKMAERGFVTLSIDLSFWGGSEGEPRNAVLPEVYAEDFSAAVDFLPCSSCRSFCRGAFCRWRRSRTNCRRGCTPWRSSRVRGWC